MKRLLSLLISTLLCATLLCGCDGLVSGVPSESGVTMTEQNGDALRSASTGDSMTKIRKEYEQITDSLENFPISFIYDDVWYNGFSKKQHVKEISRSTEAIRYGEKTTVVMQLDALTITLEFEFFEDYNAYDYTVYFENASESNSKILRCVNDADMYFEGANPHLKGILGDYDYQYAPYDKDLTTQAVEFINTRGRSCHTTFPYFNLETEDGGAMLAIGWGGTLQAGFSYDQTENKTHFTGSGTAGLATYLKPGEKVCTAMIGVVRYYERDENVATNAWRRWVIDCVYPRDSDTSEEVVQPFSTYYFAFDTDNPNKYKTDGSTAEDYTSWKLSADTVYGHDLICDYQWFDAGWYKDPYGKTVETDWWGTVGTWELDTAKWPGNTFRDRVDYAHAHGQKFLVWFEPERVTHLDGMVANYGYKREWVLSDHGNNNCYINNLGNKECLKWTLNKILTFFEKYDIDLYREDFNLDPEIFWRIGDGYEGAGRKGITENLYMQGHYALWEGIIDWCAKHGKCPFVDSCASGGGRNDLWTLRYSVTLNRSDSDRFLTSTRLSMTNRICQWLPFNGTLAKEGNSLTESYVDLYTLRASYMCVFTPSVNFYIDRDTIDWDVLSKSLDEFNEIKKYLLKDFYALTPDHSTSDNTKWTAYMFFDPATDSGVLQAFRQTDCVDKSITVKVMGVDPNKYYTLRDVDGLRSIAKIKGSALQNGFRISAEDPRTAIMIYITPYEDRV